MAVTNFTEFFKEERDIFVQNISNCQVSVIFEVAPGRSESFLFTNSKDPVNLTRYIPFMAIKSSMDMRRMLNRSPPALKLMTEDEYTDYYSGMAKRHNLKNTDEAIDKAEQRRNAAQNHMPLPDAKEPEKIHEVIEDGKYPGEKKIVKTADQVFESEEINPRVLNLCLQVHPSVDDKEKMSAQQFLSEIESISGLTSMDWEYVQSHGYYKSVRNLARKQLSDLAAQGAETDGGKKKVKKSKSLESALE